MAARMLRFALCLSALGLASPGAQAEGFVNTPGGWQALSPEAQAGYVQGLNDALNFVFADDTLTEALAKRGRTRCLIERKATAASVAGEITAAYRLPRYARLAPAAVYIVRMGELCRLHINAERTAFGLDPQ